LRGGEDDITGRPAQAGENAIGTITPMTSHPTVAHQAPDTTGSAVAAGLACGHAGSSIAAVAAIAAEFRRASGYAVGPIHAASPADSGQATMATSSCGSRIPTSASHRTIGVRSITHAPMTAIAGNSGRAAETPVTTAAADAKRSPTAAEPADTTHTATASATTVPTGLRRLSVGSIRSRTPMAAIATSACGTAKATGTGGAEDGATTRATSAAVASI
jgi:hypothetical protein